MERQMISAQDSMIFYRLAVRLTLQAVIFSNLHRMEESALVWRIIGRLQAEFYNSSYLGVFGGQ